MSAHALRYAVKRNLSGLVGHDLNDVVTYALDLKSLTSSGKFVGARQDSLGGRRFTTRHRTNLVWSARCSVVFGDDVLIYAEMLSSCEDQIFTFDPYYTAGVSPGALRSVVMESNAWTQNRVVRRGGSTPHLTDGFEFAWQMREL